MLFSHSFRLYITAEVDLSLAEKLEQKHIKWMIEFLNEIICEFKNNLHLMNLKN